MKNLAGMPSAVNGSYEVVMMEPHSLSEMPQAIQALWQGKAVLLKLTMMEPEQAQRAADFVAGGTYSIDGYQQRISERIFLFTPSCVQVRMQTSIVNQVMSIEMAPECSVAEIS